MFLLHFLSRPNPLIGFGVHALHMERELAWLAGGGGFRFMATDLGRSVALEKAQQQLRDGGGELPVVNVLLDDGRSSHELLKGLPGLRVTYTVFEADTLPLGWKENLERSDLVLTASEWGAKIMRRELNKTPVAVVPEGVDQQIHHQWNRPTDLQPWQAHDRAGAPMDECFRLLSVGKFETRKSYAELLNAFQMAFSHRPDVRLLLRPQNLFDPEWAQRLEALIPEAVRPRVHIVSSEDGSEMLSTAAMAALYRYCHGFIFPSRAEGWGLPLIEAISCGTPFIASHYSGQTQFLDVCQQSFSRIEYTLEEIHQPDYLRYHRFSTERPARWAQPSVASLAHQMRQLYENWPMVRQEATVNARRIHKLFTWRAAAETLVDVITEYLVQIGKPALKLTQRTSPAAAPPPWPDRERILGYLGKRSATFSLCAEHLNSLHAPRALELGTTRSFRSGVIDMHTYEPDPQRWDWGAGCGTFVIPALVPGCQLETVDPSAEALSVARTLCSPFLNRIIFVQEMSSEYLATCTSGYDLIYMDHGETGGETAALHRSDAELIVKLNLLNPRGLILIDDQEVGNGVDGKGAEAIPWLLACGFRLLTPPGSYQALLRAPSKAEFK